MEAPMARDPDRRVSIAPQPTRSFSDSTLGAADELPPPVTVLPAVRRSRIVSPARTMMAPPRTPRSGAKSSTSTIDFIATLKARYPKGTVAHSRFTKALSIYAASSRDAAAAQLLSQEVGDIFQEEPGLVRSFQSMLEPGTDPSYAGDVYEVEWVDDPGVFHRADYQAVRAPGSSPARGVARPPTHAPASPVWAPDARAAPAASYAMLGFGQPAAPEQNSEQPAPPTRSGRAAAQEASRRIRQQS